MSDYVRLIDVMQFLIKTRVRIFSKSHAYGLKVRLHEINYINLTLKLNTLPFLSIIKPVSRFMHYTLLLCKIIKTSHMTLKL